MVDRTRHDPDSPFPYRENDVDALLRAAFKRQKEAAATGADPPFSLEPGEQPVLGDFRILRAIGQGRSGVVFEAGRIPDGGRVAVKVLARHLGLRESLLARLRRLASLATELEHPGIARVQFVGSEEGVHYLAMELVEGVPLDEVIRRLRGHGLVTLTGRTIQNVVQAGEEESAGEAVDPNRAWAEDYPVAVAGLTAQVARALDHAHGQGVIHGSVKPSNVLVRPDGVLRLTDFGLVHPADRDLFTVESGPLATPHYTAPELIEDPSAEPDARSDVFSLGAILYEMTTLERPFAGESTREVLEQIRDRVPADPCTLNPRLPMRFAAVILHALEKDPTERCPTARAVAEDLEWLARG